MCPSGVCWLFLATTLHISLPLQLDNFLYDNFHIHTVLLRIIKVFYSPTDAEVNCLKNDSLVHKLVNKKTLISLWYLTIVHLRLTECLHGLGVWCNSIWMYLLCVWDVYSNFFYCYCNLLGLLKIKYCGNHTVLWNTLVEIVEKLMLRLNMGRPYFEMIETHQLYELIK
jgi:hypothetical protein